MNPEDFEGFELPTFFVGHRGLSAVFVRTSGAGVAEIVAARNGFELKIQLVPCDVASRFIRRFAPPGEYEAWLREMQEFDQMTARTLDACSLPSWEGRCGN